MNRGEQNSCPVVFGFGQLPASPSPGWAELRGTWEFARNPRVLPSRMRHKKRRALVWFTGNHEVGCQQLPVGQVREGSRTNHVHVLPCTAHSESRLVSRFSLCVCLQGSLRHPPTHTYKALNPRLSPGQGLTEDLILHMLICCSPPGVQTRTSTCAEPSSFQKNGSCDVFTMWVWGMQGCLIPYPSLLRKKKKPNY